MTKLTSIQKKEYLKNNGLICPYCKSYEISADFPHFNDSLKTIIVVTCLNCYRKWRDIYVLKNIEPINEEDI